MARDVFAELGIEDVALAAIAKGPDRDAGRETNLSARAQAVHAAGPRPRALFPAAHPRRGTPIRDRRPSRQALEGNGPKSSLDDIPGIGAKRKKALLHHFGSAAAVAEAGRADLEAVSGISSEIANKVYDWFHGDG